MPEGHTIHRIARDHRKWFVGDRLKVSSPQGRFADGARMLDGCSILHVDAHGKHLFYEWTGSQTLHVHLGLYGKFRMKNAPLPEPRGQVRLRVCGPERGFDLHGPNQCELIDTSDRQAIIDRLGPDPLRSDANPERAWARIRQSRAAIGGLLLNQSVLAGIGNVYRAEVLFALGIHPDRPGREIERTEFDALWSLLRSWLRMGVKYNRIITTDARQLGKTPGRLTKGERLMVYKKPSCRRCEGVIRSWDCGARTVYACCTCQK